MLKKTNSYDTAVFIGRFQPFHKGHLESISIALKHSKNLVIVLGSYRMAPSLREPWSTEERIKMMRSSLNKDQLKRISFVCVRNRFYAEEIWKNDVIYEVSKTIKNTLKIALIGHEKDSSSYYLKIFPQWDFIETGNYEQYNGTQIRKSYFLSKNFKESKQVPHHVRIFLKNYRQTKFFTTIKKEFIEVKKNHTEKHMFHGFFMCGRYILLQKRNKYPGKGLYSLPGKENKKAATKIPLKFLLKEINFPLDEKTLSKYEHSHKSFSCVEINQIEKVTAHTYFYKIDLQEFPKLYESIENKETYQWILIDDLYLKEDEVYSDHFQIIQWFLKY